MLILTAVEDVRSCKIKFVWSTPTWLGISIDMESQYKPKGGDEWGEIRPLVAARESHHHVRRVLGL